MRAWRGLADTFAICKIVSVGIFVAGMFGCVKKSEDAPKGRGTASCNQWQSAFCDFAKRCNTTTAAEACEQVDGVQCTSDAVAADCATKLGAASCTALPTGCSEAEIANRSVATTLCVDWINGVCKAEARCNASADVCVAQLQAQVDCNKALGVKIGLESCLNGLDSVACGDQIPDECNDLVLATP